MIIAIIISVIIAFIGILGVIWALRFKRGIKAVNECFLNGNVIVFGLKGCGKDLTFNKVINYQNRPCYANIPYNKLLCTIKPIKDFSVEPNTFETLLNDDIKIVKKINKENTDYYISDGGNFLPSQYNNILCKLYPSLPLYYSLNRHLTNSCIHINTQNLMRVWDKLREHTAFFIKAAGTYKIFGFLITRVIIYDKQDTAKAQLEPYKATGIIKRAESRANEEQFKAQNGRVEEHWIIQHKSKVYYDSRYFHRLLYGYNSPDTV